MKTNFLRIAKSSLSLTLSLMMIVTTVFFGSFGTADAITKSDTASSDVVEDAVADINVNVEEADDAFADTTEIDKTVSAYNTTAEDTAADDKSVTVDSSSVSTSVTTTNTTTKKTEKKTPEASGDGNVVYFNPPSGWTVSSRRFIYCYAYGGTNEDSSYPGEKMTLDSSTGYYKRDVGDNTNVIFVNYGTNSQGKPYEYFRYPADQKPGLQVVNGLLYDFSANDTIDVYFENPWSGKTPAVHYFNSVSDNAAGSTWPGEAMESVGGNIYKATINAKYRQLMFTDGVTDTSVKTSEFYAYTDGYYTNSGYQGTYTSSGANFHFIYGTNNDPRTFTKELTVQNDSDGYYVEMPVDSGVSYYFGISSSSSYENLYVQTGTTSGTSISVTNDSTSDVETESRINYWVGSTEYFCSRVKAKSSAVTKVKIYINKGSSTADGHSYTVSSSVSTNAETGDTVTVVAKTGTIRPASNGKYFTKYANMANIISLKYLDSGTDVDDSPKYNVYRNSKDSKSMANIYGSVERKRTIRYTVRVYADYSDKYYVRAFCINGRTEDAVFDHRDENGRDFYYCDFVIKSEDVGPIEITPIYYYKENGNSDNYITLAVEDFVGDVKSIWGGTIACYAYYVGGNDTTNVVDDSAQNALGGYPGQPMVYINGSYYMQIPKKLDNGAVIEGITLNNYVWDEIHARKLTQTAMNKTSIGTVSDSQKQAKNCQTYDYDDFVALRDTRSADRIIFNFKYRSYNNNDSSTDSPYIGNTPTSSTTDLSYVSSNGNGWNALVDYYDVPVDLFARRIANTSTRYTGSSYLSANDKYLNESYVESSECTDKVYVVSDGYVAYYSEADNDGKGTGSKNNKYVGQYGTRWYVYKKSGSSYNYVGALPPSAFLTGLTESGDSVFAKTFTEDNNAYSEAKFLNYGDALTSNKITANDGTQSNTYNSYSTWNDYDNIYKQCAGYPVVITYESNIYADGVDNGTGTNTYYSKNSSDYYATSEQPGYRCDGRWYYSKANQIITGDIEIKIIKKDSEGKIVYNNKGNIVYDDDTFLSNSNVGSITGQSAYFTNETTDAHGESYYGKTHTEVYEDMSSDFTFKASDNSTVKKSYTFDGDSNASDVVFKFVGWYLETGSGLLNDVSSDVTGNRQMDAPSTFVAVYEPVKLTDRSVIISHELYSTLYDSLTNKTGVTAPQNGTGTPYINSIVIANGDTTYYNSTTKVNQSVIIDSSKLTDQNATITITLSTTPANSETTYEGVYIPKTDSGYLENTASSTSTTGTKADSVAVNTSNGTTTYTYTYNVSDLFATAQTTGVVELTHYSDLSTTRLAINFKYYDRVTSADSHTETISTTASTVAISASATISGTSSIENAIANGLGTSSYNSTTGTNTSMSTLKNLIDEYYFWTSTNEAVTGIKALPNYHAKNTSTDKTDITSYYSTKYGNGDYTDVVLANHLDCYGVPNGGLKGAESPSNAAGYSAEAWVTYTKTNGTSVTYTSQSAFASSGDTLSNVKSVTVWGYNAPRTYTVSLYKPTNYSSLTQNGDVYYTNTTGVTPSEVTAFYNQRLAGEDKNYTGSNSASAYLGEYGITGYFGDDSAVTADKEITLSDGTTKVVFDGWYDSATHTKISSDRKYGYRVTTNLSLVAGYKASKTNGTKVSIINNGVEPFIDANNQSRVRLTTVVNVYDNLDMRETIKDDSNNDVPNPNYLNPKDNDDCIKKVTAIYVQLPVKDSVGNQITWNSNNLAALNLDSTTEGIGKAVRDYLVSSDFTSNTEVKNSDTLTITIDVSSVTFGVETTSTKNGVNYGEVTEKIISYTYDVTFDSAGIDANTTMLTNKNRVQFTLPMKAEFYYGTGDVAGSNSAIIAYAAIYYDTTDDNTENGSWIVSENHAEFIAPVVAGNSGL